VDLRLGVWRRPLLDLLLRFPLGLFLPLGLLLRLFPGLLLRLFRRLDLFPRLLLLLRLCLRHRPRLPLLLRLHLLRLDLRLRSRLDQRHLLRPPPRRPSAKSRPPYYAQIHDPQHLRCDHRLSAQMPKLGHRLSIRDPRPSALLQPPWTRTSRRQRIKARSLHSLHSRHWR